MRYLGEKEIVQLHQKLDDTDEINLNITTSKTNKPKVLIEYEP